MPTAAPLTRETIEGDEETMMGDGEVPVRVAKPRSAKNRVAIKETLLDVVADM